MVLCWIAITVMVLFISNKSPSLIVHAGKTAEQHHHNSMREIKKITYQKHRRHLTVCGPGERVPLEGITERENSNLPYRQSHSTTLNKSCTLPGATGKKQVINLSSHRCYSCQRPGTGLWNSIYMFLSPFASVWTVISHLRARSISHQT